MAATRITLQLEPSAERIAGLITIRDGAPRPFTGYVELLAALEGARELPVTETEAPPPEGGNGEPRIH